MANYILIKLINNYYISIYYFFFSLKFNSYYYIFINFYLNLKNFFSLYTI